MLRTFKSHNSAKCIPVNKKSYFNPPKEYQSNIISKIPASVRNYDLKSYRPLLLKYIQVCKYMFTLILRLKNRFEKNWISNTADQNWIGKPVTIWKH